MNGRQGCSRLQFNENSIIHHQISNIFSYDKTISIANDNGFLLFNFNTGFFQTVFENILVDFLKITWWKINMHVERRLTYKVRQLIDL